VNDYVLDASALLALLNEEEGKARVEAILGEAVVSAVNACEILGKLIDAGVPERDARTSLELLNLQVIPFDAEMAYTAACLRPQTRRFGLSLGDRCCLALGMVRQSTVVTTERAWSKLKIGVNVEVVR
jgi:PIN domain nuclease of toxin-antitoxin system